MQAPQSRHSSAASIISAVSEDDDVMSKRSQQTGRSCDESPLHAPSIQITEFTYERREPLETAPFLPSDNIPPDKQEQDHVVGVNAVSSSTGDATWLPLTLRLPYLCFLFALSLCLGILVLFLTIYSSSNHGLGDDNDSSILLFGWRFTPTLVATIYGLLVASMLNDVRRTEIYARLSKPGGASAADTLCYPSRSWWNDPFDALSKGEGNSSRSWALFLASMIYIWALVVSPLSAGLLSPADVQIPHRTNFHRANVTTDFSWPTDAEDLIMFRTISGAVLEQSTSAWLTTSSAILPFWPSDYNNAPLGSNFSAGLHPVQWKARTVAYTIDLECEQMQLVAQYNATYNWTEMQSRYVSNGTLTSVPTNQSANYTFLDLSSQDGCHIMLADSPDSQVSSGNWMRDGGGWWAGPPRYNTSLLEGMSNSTLACGNRTMFFINSAMLNSEPIRTQAHLCLERFYSAEVLATASMNQSSTVITFDPEEYSLNRKFLDPSIYNVSRLQEAFLSSNWSTHFLRFDDNTPAFAGPLMSIAASTKYNNDPLKLLADSNLQQEASKIYQQFLGEMLLAALRSSIDQDAETVTGQRIILQQRILVSLGIGVSLAVILLISSGCIAFVAYSTTLRRRVLSLTQDPGSISAVTSLISADKNVRAAFGAHGNLSVGNENDSLIREDKTSSIISTDKGKDARPIVLHGWIGVLLLSFLLALIAAIAALYTISCTTGIHQSPFVYQLRMSVLNKATTLAPYSIIPTLLAVGVKLWFGAVGDTLKVLQPYVSMVKAPVPTSKSVLAEYTNTPIVLASAKALKNYHWILASVGIGALATEAFTVGMSALWNREVGALNHSSNVTRRLELRTIPQIFQNQYYVSHGLYMDSTHTAALSSIYQSSLQSWLYGAAVELTQSGSTPAWSKDTWSFIPLDPEDLKGAANSSNGDATDVPGYTSNVTFQTPALRARLECHTLDYPSNKSAWLKMINFRNRTIDPETNQSTWNFTNSPPGLDKGYTLTGMAGRGPRDGYYMCCANETDGTPGDAAIGYWTNRIWASGYSGGDPYYGDMQMSLTAKWIVGRPLEKLYQPNPGYDFGNPPLFIWPEEPEFLLVNCTPVIEHANASVVVELKTGVVHSYDILESPQSATEAWLDNYLLHNTSVDYAGEWVTAYGTGENITTYTNMTVSWGYVFWDALLNSGRASEINANKLTQYETEPETLTDRSFNFRTPGLNSDFMSYSMLALANNSKQTLLDPDAFIHLANKTFGVFFKHFVSDNVTSTSGGNAYQPIGEKLPWSLGPIKTYNEDDDEVKDQGVLGIQNKTASASPFVSATIQTPTEQLVMSPIAVYLCLSLLAILVLVTIVMYTANHSHYKELPRNVDTLASTLAFVYGSEKLLAWVETAPRTQPWYKTLFSKSPKDKATQMNARIGPFKDSDGVERWGIELVEPDIDTNQVETRNGCEWIELRQTEEPMKDDDGDLAMQTGLLGSYDWEASSASASYSYSTEREMQEVQLDSEGEGGRR